MAHLQVAQARPASRSRALAWQPGPPGGRRLWPRTAFADKRLHRRGPRALAKNVLFSSELRGFAPSREPVISARSACCCPMLAIVRQSSPPRRPRRQARTAQRRRPGAQPGPECLRSRPCGCRALLKSTAKKESSVYTLTSTEAAVVVGSGMLRRSAFNPSR